MTFAQKDKWIMIRKGEVRQVFNNRKEAVKFFKELLNQTLKDFAKQDKDYEFTYEFTIPEIIFKRVNKRSWELSLI